MKAMQRFIDGAMRRIRERAGGQLGGLTIFVMVSTVIALYVVGGFVGLVLVQNRSSEVKAASELAFQIAEAGVDYYRWHLAHDDDDYWDGNPMGTPGPFVHDYFNKDNEKVGEFALTITQPPLGSTIVTIVSEGTVEANPGISRTVRARYAIPSLAQFAIAVHNDVRFGTGTEVFGPIHSNGGIRFDGLAHNLVTSGVSSYTDPDSGENEWGVYTTVAPQDPQPPTNLPVRPDVFEAGRMVDVPPIDFDGFAVDLGQIRTDADPLQGGNGIYLADSGAIGYHLVLNVDDTVDIYTVTALVPAPAGCASGQTGWGTWSIQTEAFLRTDPLPANGLIFVEDHVWVDGQIDGARLTIASGVLPENPLTNTNIIVNNDLLYTNYDGTDVIALMAQEHHRVGLVSEDDLRIDAAIVAMNGSTGRFYYDDPDCGAEATRNTLTLYGMLASRLRYGYAYTDGTGYANRNLIYDANLLYGPPPSFPLTSGAYELMSWEEVF
jgi:hypothetical protein